MRLYVFTAGVWGRSPQRPNFAGVGRESDRSRPCLAHGTLTVAGRPAMTYISVGGLRMERGQERAQRAGAGPAVRAGRLSCSMVRLWSGRIGAETGASGGSSPSVV
jgi:hypothetical protein